MGHLQRHRVDMIETLHQIVRTIHPHLGRGDRGAPCENHPFLETTVQDDAHRQRAASMGIDPQVQSAGTLDCESGSIRNHFPHGDVVLEFTLPHRGQTHVDFAPPLAEEIVEQKSKFRIA